MTTKEEALEGVCLRTITGSRAYGLSHADSDTDEMGVFIAPTVKVAGLNWNTHSESWTNTSPDGDDISLHEVGKYLRLVLGGNPTLVELLFMDDYSVLTPEGQYLIDIRDKIISTRAIRNAYYGYAHSQLIRVVEAGHNFKPKMARHTLRISRQGKELLETGKCIVRVTNPQEYFELTTLPFLEMVNIIRESVESIKEAESVLLKEPERDTINEILEGIRRNNI